MCRQQLPSFLRPLPRGRGVAWSLALGLALSSGNTRAAELQGKALKKTDIRVAEAESLVVREAIPDLLHYIQGVTDVRLKVKAKPLAEDADRTRPAILVGQYAIDDGLQVPQSRFGVDGYAIDVSDAISSVEPLERAQEMFDRLYSKEPGLNKIILKPGD